MTSLKKGIRFIQKIDNAIFKFIDGVNNDTLYLFDFNEVKEEYVKVKALYKNTPTSFDLIDFANNYSFAYYQKQNLLDYQDQAMEMSLQVVAYIKEEKKKGNL